MTNNDLNKEISGSLVQFGERVLEIGLPIALHKFMLYKMTCLMVMICVSEYKYKYKYKYIFAGTQRGERVSRYGCEGTTLHLSCPEGQLLQVHHHDCYQDYHPRNFSCWIVSHIIVLHFLNLRW